jgi:hypothetical protein
MFSPIALRDVGVDAHRGGPLLWPDGPESRC